MKVFTEQGMYEIGLSWAEWGPFVSFHAPVWGGGCWRLSPKRIMRGTWYEYEA